MSALGEEMGVAPAAPIEEAPEPAAVSVGLDRRRLVIGLAVAAIVLVVGLQMPSIVTSTYYQGVIVSGVILGIMALGIGFLAHRSGLVSLGQTAFYGGAAYLVAIATTHWGWSPDLAALVGFVGGTVLALIVGAVVIRTPGMAFVMLTLAFGQTLYALVILDSVRSTTGSFDGLNVTFKSSSQTFLGLSQSDLGTSSSVWPLVWVSVVVVAVVLWLVGRSRVGTLLEAIRENEERARFSGYNTYIPRLIAFTLAGAAASLAGVLFAMSSEFVSPDVLSFTTAGNALIATIVGGVGTLVGPVVGAVLYIYGQSKFASGNLNLYTGIALIVVLVFLPGGIVGSIVRYGRAGLSRLRR
jgi:branched-chain amino acid transport system permease protein